MDTLLLYSIQKLTNLMVCDGASFGQLPSMKSVYTVLAFHSMARHAELTLIIIMILYVSMYEIISSVFFSRRTLHMCPLSRIQHMDSSRPFSISTDISRPTLPDPTMDTDTTGVSFASSVRSFLWTESGLVISRPYRAADCG